MGPNEAYDVKLKKAVKIVNPKIVVKQTKRGPVRFLTGKSAESGIKVFRILPRK